MAAFMSFPFASLEGSSFRRPPVTASAASAIHLVLEDDSALLRAADAVRRTREYLVLVERYIDWGRRNFPDLLIAGLTLGTIIELAVTQVAYNKAVIPAAVVSGPL